jgi:acyl-CoA reductase-like NAD-dependent aldehyde dehydrogenase
MTLHAWQEKAAAVRPDGRPFIDGQRVDALTDAQFDVLNPQSGARLASLPDCGQADVDRAVASARKAFDSGVWAMRAPYERSQVLRRFGQLALKHGEELGLLETLQMGSPIGVSVPLMDGTDEILRECANQADKLHDIAALSAPTALALNVRRPHGVVAAITPWNVPVHTALMKVAPALAMGNSVVLKPSELAPLACLRLADLAIEAGVPPGVFNALPGLGANTGRALALHHDVDCLAFTGSTATGLMLMQYAGQSNMKSLLLECGGKSPHLVFDDVGDIDSLADELVQGFTWNSGQVCNAGTRILVAESLYDRLMPLLTARVDALAIGNPLDPATLLGPLASTAQFSRVTSLLAQARSTDQLVARSKALGGSPNAMAPQLFASSDPHSPLMQEELFGPIACVTQFADEAEAVALANNSRYGLAATVWSRDFTQAHRVVRALRAGFVVSNAVAKPKPALCYYMGGEPVGMSGFGADGGSSGLLAYTRLRLNLFHLG